MVCYQIRPVIIALSRVFKFVHSKCWGVDQAHAFVRSRPLKGGWALALSTILITTITKSLLRRKGY